MTYNPIGYIINLSGQRVDSNDGDVYSYIHKRVSSKEKERMNESECVRFERWIKEVDDLMFENMTVSIDDLEDQPYYDMYIAGLSPYNAYREVLAGIEYNGWLNSYGFE